jgi:hypothetical protein
MAQEHPPSIFETAFACPHCGVYTTQYWFKLYAVRRSAEQLSPTLPTNETKEFIEKNEEFSDGEKEEYLSFVDNVLSGKIFLEYNQEPQYLNYQAHNIYLGRCYNCDKFSVWVHNRLLFPIQKSSVAPNQDLPDEIIKDFDEAREIVDASPRGAAALLRLCIQKLCIHLKEEGINLDEDIGNLVIKGLNPLLQYSLDIVRVIGDEAVPPGELDPRDDVDTAMRLFEIVNAIADGMISHPKNVKTMYDKLSESKQEEIKNRDSQNSEEIQ